MRTQPIVSSDGATTVAEVHGTTGPHVVFLPGLGVPISYYEPFLTDWAARGFVIFALELRGMPQSSTADIRAHDFGYAHVLDQELPAVIAQTPLKAPFILAGHSLGGQLSLLHAGRGLGDVSAVVTIASGSSHHSALPTAARRLLRRTQVAIITGSARVLGYHAGHRLGFGGLQPRTMIGDWAREARTGRYALTGSSTDDEAGLATIRQPVLMVTLEGDRLISPAAAQLLGARATGADVTALHLEGSFDHFRWARKQPTVVAAAISGWLGA